jgi:hypothetical protein
LFNLVVIHKFLDTNSGFKNESPNFDFETVKDCEFLRKDSDNKEFLTTHRSSLAEARFRFKLKSYWLKLILFDVIFRKLFRLG